MALKGQKMVLRSLKDAKSDKKVLMALKRLYFGQNNLKVLKMIFTGLKEASKRPKVVFMSPKRLLRY